MEEEKEKDEEEEEEISTLLKDTLNCNHLSQSVSQ